MKRAGSPRRRRLAVMLLCCLAPAALAATSAAMDFAALTAQIEAIRVAANVPGVVILISGPDEILHLAALGEADRATRAPLRVDQYLRIGSITKTFNAIAVMRLVERGALSLDAPVAGMLARPPFRNPWERARPLTIAHLLEHTGGLRDLTPAEFAFNAPVSLAAAFAIAPASRDLRWPPGLYPSYSNHGAGILAAVLERLSGETYEAVVAREVFAPLAMTSASFLPETRVLARLATGYDADGETAIPYWHMLYRALGAINVEPREMAALLQLMLQRGRYAGRQILSPASVARMETPRTSLAARAGVTYGYGLGVYQTYRRGVSFYGHGGDADGYLAHLAYAPALGLGYFVSINAFNKAALKAMRRAIEDRFTASQRVRAPAALRLPAAVRTALAGSYDPVTRRFPDAYAPGVVPGRMRIVDVAGALATETAGGRQRGLIAVTPETFRRAGEAGATIAIIRDAGDVYLQGNDLGNYRRVRDGE